MGDFALNKYVEAIFEAVERGPEDMRHYQNECVEFLMYHPFSGLFIDVGMGKSVISLTAVMNLVMQFECNRVLVIAPKRVANETWPTEIREWRHTTPLTFAHIRDKFVVETVNQASRDERKQIIEEALWEGKTLDEAKEVCKTQEGKVRLSAARIAASRKAVREHMRNNPAVIYIINRENIEFLVEAWGRNWPYDTVIIDESDSFKDHSSNRFKALRRVRPLIKRLHCMTATPCAETYLHLFAQIYLLDEGARLGKNITKYRERYFTQNRYTYKWTLRPGAEEEIAAKIADISMVMKAEDYLDLEKPHYLRDKIILDPEVIELYRKMETDLIVTLPEGQEVEAETAAALSQKLLQMASGVLYDTLLEEKPDGGFRKRRVVYALHEAKIEKLRELVEECQPERLIVAYWHESSLARLKEAFPTAVVMDDDGKCVKAWNAGKINMLLLHPASAGHGLNLQHGGRRIVFFDIPWSLTLYKQLIGRLAGARQLARPEDMRVVFIHHLIAAGTIDEEVMLVLEEKDDAQELMFRLLKKIRKLLLLRKNDTKL